MARFMVKASEYKNVCKAVNDRELAELKKEIIEILKKQDEKEFKKAIDYLNSQELYYTHLEKSIMTGKWVEKAGYGIGTVRTWKGKKYKKVAQGKWVRVFDKEGRGTSIAIGKLIAKVQKIDNVDDLMALVMENKQRFVDENGMDLPILDKLRAAVDSKNGNVGSKGTSAPKEKKLAENKNEDKDYKYYKNNLSTDDDLENISKDIKKEKEYFNNHKDEPGAKQRLKELDAKEKVVNELLKEKKETSNPAEKDNYKIAQSGKLATQKQVDYATEVADKYSLTRDEMLKKPITTIQKYANSTVEDFDGGIDKFIEYMADGRSEGISLDEVGKEFGKLINHNIARKIWADYESGAFEVNDDGIFEPKKDSEAENEVPFGGVDKTDEGEGKEALSMADKINEVAEKGELKVGDATFKVDKEGKEWAVRTKIMNAIKCKEGIDNIKNGEFDKLAKQKIEEELKAKIERVKKGIPDIIKDGKLEENKELVEKRLKQYSGHQGTTIDEVISNHKKDVINKLENHVKDDELFTQKNTDDIEVLSDVKHQVELCSIHTSAIFYKECKKLLEEAEKESKTEEKSAESGINENTKKEALDRIKEYAGKKINSKPIEITKIEDDGKNSGFLTFEFKSGDDTYKMTYDYGFGGEKGGASIKKIESETKEKPDFDVEAYKKSKKKLEDTIADIDKKIQLYDSNPTPNGMRMAQQLENQKKEWQKQLENLEAQKKDYKKSVLGELLLLEGIEEQKEDEEEFLLDNILEEDIDDMAKEKEEESLFNDYSAEESEEFNSTEFMVREALNRRFNCL